MDTLTGLALALIGGAMQGAFVLPMKYLRKWNWENGWLIFTLINCVIFPVALLALTVPGFMDAYRETSFTTLNLVFWFGFGWGIGNILFGLGAKLLGMAVGIATITGINACLGTLFPIFFLGQRKPAGAALLLLVLGLVLLLAGIIVISMAAKRKEDELAAATPETHHGGFFAGLLVCIASGIFCPMMNFSIFFGKPITDAAARITASHNAAYPMLTIALVGGSLAQIVYCFFLFSRNKSFGRFGESGAGVNWALALAMSIAWFGGMLLYALASNIYLGEIGPVMGWPLFLSATIIVSNILGVLTKEWKGVSRGALLRMYAGIVLVIGAVVLVSLSNAYIARGQ